MRFDKETSSIIVECIQLMPSEIVNSNTTISEPDFSNLLKLYDDDLPFSRGFDSEMDMWKIKWTKMPSEANELDTPEKVLRHTDKDFYPNIHALLVIITTLPVTSCECEKSISLLRHLKTALRSTMGKDRLNSLALIKCHEKWISTLKNAPPTLAPHLMQCSLNTPCSAPPTLAPHPMQWSPNTGHTPCSAPQHWPHPMQCSTNTGPTPHAVLPEHPMQCSPNTGSTLM
ncbi:hypothetical protein EMCRGX_G018988 [Ephydatia muelleri]